MSGLDLLRYADLQTEREVAREPAKAWRNWWLVVRAHVNTRDGETFPGQHLPSEMLWPSKEVAEEKSRITLGKYEQIAARRGETCPIKYAGAYPEGERP